jgi:periplasmic divalent cation tolerance protein
MSRVRSLRERSAGAFANRRGARDEADPLVSCLAKHGAELTPGVHASGRGTMERAVFVYTTWPTAVEAEAAGRTLVERRLAACVNILPGMTSIYRWQGALERAEEAVMIVKTRASLTGDVTDTVKQLHSYETPAILVMPLESVEKSYLGWLLAETGDISKD